MAAFTDGKPGQAVRAYDAGTDTTRIDFQTDTDAEIEFYPRDAR